MIGASTDQIVQKATSASAGQVVLMHDNYSTTTQAVSRIVSGLAAKNLCPGEISPSTGRAVAPSGAASTNTGTTVSVTPITGGTTPVTGTGGCTASWTAAESWGDRFNGTIAVSGASNWTVSIGLGSNQTIINSWNATVSGTSGQATATSSGNSSFGITIQDQGQNRNQPTLSCSAR